MKKADKYFHLLEYFVSQRYGIVDWVGLPNDWGPLCIDACCDGYLESYCDSEVWQITESGRSYLKGLQREEETCMGEAMEERYPMCQDQPAQIDCRVEFCAFYSGGGHCSNVSPAITLNPGSNYVCWSARDVHLSPKSKKVWESLLVHAQLHVVRHTDRESDREGLFVSWPIIDAPEFEYYTLVIKPEGCTEETIITARPCFSYYPDAPRGAFEVEVSAYGAGGSKRYYIKSAKLERVKGEAEAVSTKAEGSMKVMAVSGPPFMDGYPGRIKTEEETMKVLAVSDYSALQVETDECDWPSFRRYRADVWEVCMNDSWESVDSPDQIRELEDAFQKFMREQREHLVLQEDVISRPGIIVEVDMLQDVGMAEATKQIKEQLRKLRADAQYPLFYRRLYPGAWEASGDHWAWERVNDPMLAELENTYQNSMPEEAIGSTLKDRGQRYTDDFEWRASPTNEYAQANEALAYLAGVGEVFHPWWAWTAFEGMYPSLFQRDHCGLKVRQWRGPGFSREGLLTNGGKWGVILVIYEEELVRLWHKSSDEKLEFAKQITRETIEHTVVVGEGMPYPEFVPTFTEDSGGAS